MNPKIIILKSKYNRKIVNDDKTSMYIFTDNLERTSNKYATIENVNINFWYYKKYYNKTPYIISYGTLNNPTSAIIRGLNNAYPISTMKKYGVNFNSEDFELFKNNLDDEILQIKNDLHKFKGIKIGNYRIGCGGLKAKLPDNCQEYLDKKLLELNIDNRNTYPIILNDNWI